MQSFDQPILPVKFSRIGEGFVIVGYGVSDIGLWADGAMPHEVLRKDRARYSNLMVDKLLANNQESIIAHGAEKLAEQVNEIAHDDRRVTWS